MDGRDLVDRVVEEMRGQKDVGLVRPGAQGPADSTAKGTQDPRPLHSLRQDEEARLLGWMPLAQEDIGRQGLVPGDTTGEGEKAPVCAAAHCLEQCLA